MMRGIDVAANVSCTDVVVVTVRDGRARVVDDGGDPVIRSVEYRGKVGFPMGPLRISSIQWSPDSTWFAYLKKHDGRVQLWIVSPAMPPRQVSRTQWDIDGFVVESAGRIIIWGQPGLAEMRKAITMESRSGYHFDGRFSPMTAKTPFSPPGWQRSTSRSIRVRDPCGPRPPRGERVCHRLATAPEAHVTARETVHCGCRPMP
ncbi:hypothetical protein ACFSLT_29055 [Novosphingobium resinovorum]